MLIALALFGAVAVAGITATVLQLRVDGYRRVPTRTYRTLP